MDDVSAPTAVVTFLGAIGGAIKIAGWLIERSKNKRVAAVAAEPTEQVLPASDVFARLEQTVRNEADWKVAAHRAKWDADNVRLELAERDAQNADLERQLAMSRHQAEGLRQENDRLRVEIERLRSLNGPNDTRPPPGRPGGGGRHPVALAPDARPTRRPVPR